MPPIPHPGFLELWGCNMFWTWMKGHNASRATVSRSMKRNWGAWSALTERDRETHESYSVSLLSWETQSPMQCHAGRGTTALRLQPICHWMLWGHSGSSIRSTSLCASSRWQTRPQAGGGSLLPWDLTVPLCQDKWVSCQDVQKNRSHRKILLYHV